MIREDLRSLISRLGTERDKDYGKPWVQSGADVRPTRT
jgi:hypothetical protein